MICLYRKPRGREEGERMAKKLLIEETRNSFRLVLDDHELTEVISYKLESSYGRNTLTVVTEIWEDDVTVKIEEPQRPPP